MMNSFDEHVTNHFDHDEYHEVINGADTYGAIAAGLAKGHSVIIGWTDQEGTHLDVMFTAKPIQGGGLQRGMYWETDLFVAVSHFGFFGFEIKDEYLHPGYVGEKLGLGGTENATTAALTDLISEVRKRLL